MNWYKKAQQIIEKPGEEGIAYTSIGHGWNDRGSEDYNMIWIYMDGKVIAVEETSQFPSHHSFNLPSGVDMNKLYTGRYEPADQRLSVAIPLSQTNQRISKRVPEPILRQLLSKFPDTRGVYVF